MDEVASEIHNLVRKFCQGEISGSEFTSRLRNVKQRHPNAGNIGRAINKGLRLIKPEESEKEEVWRLVQSVDPEIIAKYEEWTDASNWDIG